METAEDERIRIFPKNWERVLLFLGLVPIVFAFWNPGWLAERWKLKLVSNLLFLSIVHTSFSIYIMWRSDEVRLAINQHTNGKPWRLHLRALAIFSVSCVCYDSLFHNLLPRPILYVWTVIFDEFLAAHHSISQQLGLSLLYDHVQKRSPTLSQRELRRISAAAKWERLFHFVILFGIGLTLTSGVGQRLMDGKSGPVSSGQLLQWGKFAVIFGIAGMVATHVARPQWYRSNKWIFSLRRIWLIWVETTLVNPAFLASRALNHGFEYLAVTAAVDRNSKKTRIRLLDITVFLGLAALVAYFYVHQLIYEKDPTPLNSWFFSEDITPILAILSASNSITHYYYDSQIFRFSRPAFRDNVLPLIVPNHDSGQSPSFESRSAKP